MHNLDLEVLNDGIELTCSPLMLIRGSAGFRVFVAGLQRESHRCQRAVQMKHPDSHRSAWSQSCHYFFTINGRCLPVQLRSHVLLRYVEMITWNLHKQS